MDDYDDYDDEDYGLEKEDDEYMLIKKSLYKLPITREMKYFQTYKPYLMQVRNEYNMVDRSLYYWSKLYNKSLKKI